MLSALLYFLFNVLNALCYVLWVTFLYDMWYTNKLVLSCFDPKLYLCLELGDFLGCQADRDSNTRNIAFYIILNL